MSSNLYTNYQISVALNNVAPNSEWVLIGDNYDELQWLSDGTKPAWSVVKAEIDNPTPKAEPTVSEKLASVGLNLDDLKSALGL